MLAKETLQSPSPVTEVDGSTPAISGPAATSNLPPGSGGIELEDLTDPGAVGERLAAMRMLRWVAQRRAQGMLPD